MHDFIEYIIKKLVDKPDSVQLAQEENEANKVVFQLKVDQRRCRQSDRQEGKNRQRNSDSLKCHCRPRR